MLATLLNYLIFQSYLLNLVFHLFDIILPGLNLFLQFLDLIIQHKLELLQFLVLLFQVINSLFLKIAKKNPNISSCQLLNMSHYMYQHFLWIPVFDKKYSKSVSKLTLSWMVSSLSTISLRSPWISFFIFSFSPFSLDTSDLNLLISSLWSSISRCWLINYKK